MADEASARDSAERREQFRVRDRVLVDMEPIDDAEVERRYGDATDPWPSAFGLTSRLHEMRQESLVLRRQAERESSAFARLVDLLDRKIDQVAEVVLLQDLQGRKTVALDVDIGAEGMGFSWPRPLAAGSVLDMRLVMPSTGLGLHSLARVVHCARSEGQTWQLGLRFEFLRAHDRELLFHHILRRESMLLRQRQQQRGPGETTR